MLPYKPYSALLLHRRGGSRIVHGRVDVGIAPYESYPTSVRAVGANCVRPRADNIRPYGFYPALLRARRGGNLPPASLPLERAVSR